MPSVVATLLDIVRCRRGPQDLPVSRALLGSLLVTYVVCNFVQAAISGWTTARVAPLIAVEVLMLMGWVWALLAFYGRRARYLQTMSAVLAIALILTLADILLITVGGLVALPDPVSNAWSVIRLFVMVLLVGRVLMIAIEGGLLTGFAFTMMMILSIFYVAQQFSPAG